MTVDTDAEAEDGWVAVKYKGQTAYVSADYVTTELALGEAVTIEERKGSISKEKLRKRQRQKQHRLQRHPPYRMLQFQHLMMM